MIAGTKLQTFRLTLAAILLLFVVGIAAMFMVSVADIGRSRKSFPARHEEATQFIEAVYRHRSATGGWPDATIASQLASLPSEWQYNGNVDPTDLQSPPVLYLHGPYHMIIAYYFLPPDDGELSRHWTMSREGDKTEFESEQPYRP